VPVPDLEYTPQAMRTMADDVVARCIAHIASLPTQPVRGDMDVRALCVQLRESAPEQGTALAPLLDDLFKQWSPRSFSTPCAGYVAFIRGGGL
jgi:hypothetical protein